MYGHKKSKRYQAFVLACVLSSLPTLNYAYREATYTPPPEPLCPDSDRETPGTGCARAPDPGTRKIHRSLCAPALCIGHYQRDGFPDTRAASPLLVPTCDQVGIKIENICHPQPVVLDATKLFRDGG